MWIAAMMLAVLAALMSPLLAGRIPQQQAVSSAAARALADSMAVYRAAARTWAQGQPGFEGVVPAAAITTPAWSQPHASLRAAVQGRFVAVYVTGPAPAGLLQEMLGVAGGAIWVGRADGASGHLHSPAFGDTGLPVPQWVPDQAPVWLALRD